jgi:hypothetical protein
MTLRFSQALIPMLLDPGRRDGTSLKSGEKNALIEKQDATGTPG